VLDGALRQGFIGMARYPIRPTTRCILIFLALAGFPDLVAQDTVRRSVIAAAAGQFTAIAAPLLEQVSRDTLAGSISYPFFDSTNIRRPIEPEKVGSLLVWRIPPPITHQSPLTVATWPGGLLRLAGFPEPEVWAASRALRAPVRSGREAWAVARMLAQLIAPTEPSLVVFPDDPGQSQTDSTVQAWHIGKPMQFEADTVIARSDGSYTVRITWLAFLRYAYGPTWDHSQATLHIGGDGVLLGLRWTVSPEFHLRAPVPIATLRALSH
jgi:hypothetical protein